MYITLLLVNWFIGFLITYNPTTLGGILFPVYVSIKKKFLLAKDIYITYLTYLYNTYLLRHSIASLSIYNSDEKKPACR